MCVCVCVCVCVYIYIYIYITLKYPVSPLPSMNGSCACPMLPRINSYCFPNLKQTAVDKLRFLREKKTQLVNSLKWVTFFNCSESGTAIKIGQKLCIVIKIVDIQVLTLQSLFQEVRLIEIITLSSTRTDPSKHTGQQKSGYSTFMFSVFCPLYI